MSLVTLPVIVLVGATATGKSALAVDLALALAGAGHPAEVVNADSMLVYRGMDIGTAKPSLAERRGVAHHLIDIMDIDQPASVALFQGLARAAIEDCRARGAVPIVVGGSALYLHAVIDRFDFPPTDPAVRQRLTRQCETEGVAAMYQRLEALDPGAAAGIQPGNVRRIIRALEAIELTGEFRSRLPDWSYALGEVVQLGLDSGRDQMDQRIRRRVERMWEQGFVEEVRRLRDRGLAEAPTASRAIGYRQVLDHLAGRTSEEEARETTVVRTRQFSRKQLSWWKRDPRIHWLAVGTKAGPALETVVRWLDGPPLEEAGADSDKDARM